MSRFYLKVGKAVKILFTLKNWSEVYRYVFFKHPLDRIIRRDGIKISSQSKMELWNHYNDIWENKSYAVIEDIQKQDIVIEIGANIGIFTILASLKAKRVFSFEPMVENYKYLKNNISINNLDNVNIFNYAVAARNEQRKLHVTRSTTAHNFFSDNTNANEEEINITCRKLESIMEENIAPHKNLNDISGLGSFPRQ